MPKLLIFAPCDKVIIGVGDNNASLIDILQNINIGMAAGKPIPENAMAAMRWAVFAMWLKEPEDEGKSYKQRVQLLSPSGKVLTEVITEFQLKKAVHRVANGLQGFPIGEVGEHSLKLCLWEGKKEPEWREIAMFPLTVTHRSPHPQS